MHRGERKGLPVQVKGNNTKIIERGERVKGSNIDEGMK